MHTYTYVPFYAAVLVLGESDYYQLIHVYVELNKWVLNELVHSWHLMHVGGRSAYTVVR